MQASANAVRASEGTRAAESGAERGAPSAPAPRPRPRARIVDVLVGLVLPWGLLRLERTFVRGLLPEGVLHGCEAAAYAGTLVFTFALASWIVFQRAPRFLAGALLAGGVFAGLVGILLFPLALLGTAFLGIGLLGFLPFWIAYVYFRCSQEAWDSSARPGGARAHLACALGFGAALAVPVAAQAAVQRASERALRRVESPDLVERERGLATLRLLLPVRMPEELLSRFREATDAAEQARIAETWRSVTGEPIESYVGD